MAFLLDTHSFLWFMVGDKRLSDLSRGVIESAENDIFLSVVSLWEIAIKVSLGKLTLHKSFDDLIPEQIISNAFEVLPINLSALSLVVELPFHHRDPFDRLIIAQAITNDLPNLSKDRAFADYPVKLVW